MEKLELKDLAPYLPYGVKILINNGEAKSYVKTLESLSVFYSNVLVNPKDKLILRPLSDLTNDEYNLKIKSWFINHAENDVQITTYDNGNYIGLTATYKMMGDVFTDIIINAGGIKDTDYWLVENLLKNHFDVFGLIEAGLAIDINTLEQ